VLDARKLHRGQGAGRLFGYCTEILRFPRRSRTTSSRLPVPPEGSP
jgi:hypothetical protein